jgi:hypothetical protein
LGHNPRGEPQTLGELTMRQDEASTQTDLVRGSITINCLAKYGLQAEELANLCFFAISGNKQKFYKRGLHSLTALTIGEESILRSTSGIELTAVPVAMQYSLVKDVYTSFSTFDVILYYTPPSGVELELYEGADFTIDLNGSAITTFLSPRTGSTLTVSYVEAITGNSRVKQDLSGVINDTNTLFYLPNNESALGYYKVLTSGVISFEQGGSVYPTDFATASGLTTSAISQDIVLTSGTL